MRERNFVRVDTTPSGLTVAARLDFWRALNWEELVQFMQPTKDGGVIAARFIDAPVVPARIRAEPR